MSRMQRTSRCSKNSIFIFFPWFLKKTDDGPWNVLNRKNLIDSPKPDGLLGHAKDDACLFILASVYAPFSCMARRPLAPSEPIPVRITPMALPPALRATDWNKYVSAGSVWLTAGPFLILAR